MEVTVDLLAQLVCFRLLLSFSFDQIALGLSRGETGWSADLVGLEIFTWSQIASDDSQAFSMRMRRYLLHKSSHTNPFRLFMAPSHQSLVSLRWAVTSGVKWVQSSLVLQFSRSVSSLSGS